MKVNQTTKSNDFKLRLQSINTSPKKAIQKRSICPELTRMKAFVLAMCRLWR
jgi:hypothetical protein